MRNTVASVVEQMYAAFSEGNVNAIRNTVSHYNTSLYIQQFW